MTETIIVGGGLAGGSLACVLAEAGRPVLLVERQAGPADKICGEFISAEAKLYLDRVGVDLAEHGAHPITTLRLVHRRKMVSVRLPFAGYGLSRRVLDEVLLQRAAQLGAEIRRGEPVRLRQANPIVLDTPSGPVWQPKTVFLATGKHDLHTMRRRATPGDLVGFKQHLGLDPAQIAALSGHVELIMLRDGYAGLQMVEGGLANLCLLVSNARLGRAGGTWEALLEDLRETEPHLRARLAGAVAAARPVSIARVPYGFVHAPSAADPPGIYRVGDQMGVIPSFTGDGMSIALHTAFGAAQAYLAGVGAEEHHRRLRADIGRQISRAATLLSLANSAVARAALIPLAALWPGAIRHAAQLTRVSPAALARIGS